MRILLIFNLLQGYTTLDFLVASRHDDYELKARIIHCPGERNGTLSLMTNRTKPIFGGGVSKLSASMAKGQLQEIFEISIPCVLANVMLCLLLN
jgi:hypothetical protein